MCDTHYVMEHNYCLSLCTYEVALRHVKNHVGDSPPVAEFSGFIQALLANLGRWLLSNDGILRDRTANEHVH